MDIKDLLDPEVMSAAEAHPAPLITRKTLPDVRLAMAQMTTLPSELAELLNSTLDNTTRTIAGKNGDITLYISQPKNAPENGPVLLWIHGGGYIIGTGDDPSAQMYAMQCNCTVVSVDYRIAPEHPFPAGPEDCHDTLLWLHDHAAELDVDPNRITIGGASAGAGMAAGVTLMNRDRNGPKLAFQFLVYPMLDNLHDTPSGQFDNQPLYSRANSFSAWEMYLDGTPGKDASPYAAAARATDLSDLPPAYIAVGGADLFRDECIQYAQRLIVANVATELAVFPGLFHGAESLAAEAKASQRMRQSMLAALKNGLGI